MTKNTGDTIARRTVVNGLAWLGGLALVLRRSDVMPDVTPDVMPDVTPDASARVPAQEPAEDKRSDPTPKPPIWIGHL